MFVSRVVSGCIDVDHEEVLEEPQRQEASKNSEYLKLCNSTTRY